MGFNSGFKGLNQEENFGLVLYLVCIERCIHVIGEESWDKQTTLET